MEFGFNSIRGSASLVLTANAQRPTLTPTESTPLNLAIKFVTIDYAFQKLLERCTRGRMSPIYISQLFSL